jgi:hypothetical protein
MTQKSKNKDFKKYLNFIIPAVIVILLIVLFSSFQQRTSEPKGNGTTSQPQPSWSLFESNNLCDYNNGENCQNSPSKCACKSDQICSPDRPKVDNLGCYSPFCGDGYLDSGETSDNCCMDAGCPGNLICDANLKTCVKPQCPFDCCQNDQSYQDKSCPQYYSCSSQEHSCKPIDSDNDALPDYKEIQIGTDINNPDSDGDTVLDGYDNHPLSSYLPRTYSYDWRYGTNWLIFTKDFQFSITLSEDVVSSYENMPKINLISRDDPQLTEVAQKMTILASDQSYDEADKLMMVIAFSRSFNYDYTKASFASKPLPDWANFPMETIVKKQGLCADSAVMTAALLRKMGYDAKYLTSNACSHAIVGVPLVNGITLSGSERYVESNGQRYYYIDATSSNSAGNLIHSTTSKSDFGKTFCTSNDFVVSDY